MFGNELLDELEVCFADGRQLAQLDKPKSLYMLHGVLALHGHETLGVPAARELAYKRGLAESLLADERQDGVKLDAGVECSTNGGNERLARYGAVKCRILGAEVVDE